MIYTLIVVLVSGTTFHLPYGKDSPTCHKEAAVLAKAKGEVISAVCQESVPTWQAKPRPTPSKRSSK